jgi:excinuclease UvrABC ATPase subunit
LTRFAGAAGGKIVAEGQLAAIAGHANSHTGRYLKNILEDTALPLSS